MIPFPSHCPPSTGSTWPVMYEALGPARKQTASDLVGGTETPQRDLGLDPVDQLVGEPELTVRALRADRPGGNRVHANPVGSPLHRQAPGEGQYARFRGG